MSGTIVFTAILGTCDSLKPAPKGADAAICFVDNPADYPDWKGWILRQHTYEGDPRREAWRLRCVPHQLFEAYRDVVWIDASFTMTNLPLLLKHAGAAHIAALPHQARHTCYEEGAEIVKIGQASAEDVHRQLRAYREEGFNPSSLSISCIIVRDHSKAVTRFNEEWARQISLHRGDNTQISIEYAAWKHGLSIQALQGVRKCNPYAAHDHADHKRRRVPYDTDVKVGAR